MKAFLEGEYLVALNGADQGVIRCPTVAAMRDALRTLFPNPGCPHYHALTNPAQWEPGHDTEFPYYIEYYVTDDERGLSVINIYRVQDL